MGDSVGNQIDSQRKHLWQMCEIDQQGDQDAANDVVPTISMFCESTDDISTDDKLQVLYTNYSGVQ